MTDVGTTSLGRIRCAMCQSFVRLPFSRARSGPTRRVPHRCGWLSAFWYSCAVEGGPKRCSSFETTRTYWLWQCQQA